MSSGTPVRSGRRSLTPGQVLVVTSVMFTFISFWRTAAIVLCDLASTAYYIGGIVESQIGKAAPWFILAVMVFSYFVRMIYIESCAMFVRGGVYRVVKEAMGGTLAKLSVSALLFDYILTGPTSAVSAGAYIVGWLVDFLRLGPDHWLSATTHQNWVAAIQIATAPQARIAPRSAGSAMAQPGLMMRSPSSTSPTRYWPADTPLIGPVSR